MNGTRPGLGRGHKEDPTHPGLGHSGTVRPTQRSLPNPGLTTTKNVTTSRPRSPPSAAAFLRGWAVDHCQEQHGRSLTTFPPALQARRSTEFVPLPIHTRQEHCSGFAMQVSRGFHLSISRKATQAKPVSVLLSLFGLETRESSNPHTHSSSPAAANAHTSGSTAAPREHASRAVVCCCCGILESLFKLIFCTDHTPFTATFLYVFVKARSTRHL